MATVEDDTGEALRKWWFQVLSEIADPDLQRRTWLDLQNTNPHWSYVEFVCSYPNDEQLADARNKGWLSPTEAEILEGFRRILEAHKAPNGRDWNNEAVLDDPAWHRVVEAAQKAKAELAAITQP